MDKKELTRRLLFEAGLTEAGPTEARSKETSSKEAPDSFQVSFTAQKPERPEERTRLLLIADLPEKSALPVLRELRALSRFGFQVDALIDVKILPQLKGHAPFGNVYSVEHPFAAEILASTRALIVAPSQDLLARLALGLQDRPAAKAVLQGLWRGMDVYMLEDAATDGVPCRNAALGALYASYRNALRGIGVKPVFPPYLAAMLDRRGEFVNVKAQGDSRVGETRDGKSGEKSDEEKKRVVVTEKDVLAFDKGSPEWILPWDAVVTSLAKDAAKKRGLLLKKRAQRAGEE